MNTEKTSARPFKYANNSSMCDPKEEENSVATKVKSVHKNGQGKGRPHCLGCKQHGHYADSCTVYSYIPRVNPLPEVNITSKTCGVCRAKNLPFKGHSCTTCPVWELFSNNDIHRLKCNSVRA